MTDLSLTFPINHSISSSLATGVVPVVPQCADTAQNHYSRFNSEKLSIGKQGVENLIPFLRMNLSRQTSESTTHCRLSEFNKDRLFFRIGISIEKPSTEQQGTVHLVGAGSGDPELLTLKAYRVMQQADVVLYDSLVSEDILDMCNRSATKIFVGKRRNNHALPQQDINELLVTHAKAGKCVVRLKGGDPFIFGRGGEELQTIVGHGIHFESIPGITAASSAASSASIPLTHRDCAQSVKFITAYKKEGAPNNAYQEMLDPTQTVVLYMGLHRLPELTQGLMDAGRDTDTPFALISHASLPTQQVLIGTLDTISELQVQAKLPTPALLIMGDVVNLHHELSPYNLATIANKADITTYQQTVNPVMFSTRIDDNAVLSSVATLCL